MSKQNNNISMWNSVPYNDIPFIDEDDDIMLPSLLSDKLLPSIDIGGTSTDADNEDIRRIIDITDQETKSIADVREYSPNNENNREKSSADTQSLTGVKENKKTVMSRIKRICSFRRFQATHMLKNSKSAGDIVNVHGNSRFYASSSLDNDSSCGLKRPSSDNVGNDLADPSCDGFLLSNEEKRVNNNFVLPNDPTRICSNGLNNGAHMKVMKQTENDHSSQQIIRNDLRNRSSSTLDKSANSNLNCFCANKNSNDNRNDGNGNLCETYAINDIPKNYMNAQSFSVDNNVSVTECDDNGIINGREHFIDGRLPSSEALITIRTSVQLSNHEFKCENREESTLLRLETDLLNIHRRPESETNNVIDVDSPETMDNNNGFNCEIKSDPYIYQHDNNVEPSVKTHMNVDSSFGACSLESYNETFDSTYNSRLVNGESISPHSYANDKFSHEDRGDFKSQNIANAFDETDYTSDAAYSRTDNPSSITDLYEDSLDEPMNVFEQCKITNTFQGAVEYPSRTHVTSTFCNFHNSLYPCMSSHHHNGDLENGDDFIETDIAPTFRDSSCTGSCSSRSSNNGENRDFDLVDDVTERLENHHVFDIENERNTVSMPANNCSLLENRDGRINPERDRLNHNHLNEHNINILANVDDDDKDDGINVDDFSFSANNFDLDDPTPPNNDSFHFNPSPTGYSLISKSPEPDSSFHVHNSANLLLKSDSEREFSDDFYAMSSDRFDPSRDFPKLNRMKNIVISPERNANIFNSFENQDCTNFRHNQPYNNSAIHGRDQLPITGSGMAYIPPRSHSWSSSIPNQNSTDSDFSALVFSDSPLMSPDIDLPLPEEEFFYSPSVNPTPTGNIETMNNDIDECGSTKGRFNRNNDEINFSDYAIRRNNTRSADSHFSDCEEDFDSLDHENEANFVVDSLKNEEAYWPRVSVNAVADNVNLEIPGAEHCDFNFTENFPNFDCTPSTSNESQITSPYEYNNIDGAGASHPHNLSHPVNHQLNGDFVSDFSTCPNDLDFHTNFGTPGECFCSSASGYEPCCSCNNNDCMSNMFNAHMPYYWSNVGDNLTDMRKLQNAEQTGIYYGMRMNNGGGADEGSGEGWMPSLSHCSPRTLSDDKGDNNPDVAMIWSDYEAVLIHTKQISPSACGPTAVINVLKALNTPIAKERVCEVISVSLRREMAPIPEYLFSRSVAGTTADELIRGVEQLTNGAVVGRFFHFYPNPDVDLLSWLTSWIKKGAVPLATLNLQKAVPQGSTIPDAWHHQMIYGVDIHKGAYVTNPLGIIPEATLSAQLCSESLLLVRRQDVVMRYDTYSGILKLLTHTGRTWHTSNVLGQVVNVLREESWPRLHGSHTQITSHVEIPAVYKAGVSLFVKKQSQVYAELLAAHTAFMNR